MLAGLPKTGETDPIEYYRRPLVGVLFRKRINLGLGMLPDRRFESALELGYAHGLSADGIGETWLHLASAI